MHILISGASGFIARALIPKLLAADHHVWAWTQSPQLCAQYYGDAVHCISDLDELELQAQEIGAIINLAGAAIADKPWTQARKTLLLESRLKTTQALIGWIAGQAKKPQLLLSASAIGFYGSHDNDVALGEEAKPNPGFTHDLCRRWEEQANKAKAYGLRVCLLRTGIVLGAGAALAKMRLAFRLGLGGRVGSGQQWMSWIHIDDQVAAILFLLNSSAQSGAFNLCAPGAVKNTEFTRLYAKSLSRPAMFPLPSFVPRLMLGEGAELLLEGQRVYPQALLDAGFKFQYEDLWPALQDVEERLY